MSGALPHDAPVVAFIPSLDLDRSDAFYGGVLGLTATERSGFANAYEVAGRLLRVTAVPAFEPQPFTVLGWQVAEIAVVVGALREAGVEPLRYERLEQDDDGVWTAPGGARIAWFHDPDRNVLSVTESQVLHLHDG